MKKKFMFYTILLFIFIIILFSKHILVFIFDIYVYYSVNSFYDISYNNLSIDKNLFDVHYSKKINSSLPALIIVHGGGWIEGSKDIDQKFAKYIAYEKNYVVYSINYRLSGTDIFPAQIEDLKSVVRWIRINGDLYNTDTKNIFVLGFSAGGHLTSLLANAYDYNFSELDKSNISAKVNAVAIFAGPENLSSLVSDCKENFYCKENSDLLNYILDKLINCSIDICPDKYSIASPSYHIDITDSPVLIIHGDKDSIVPLKQALDYYDKKINKNSIAELIIENNSDHSLNSDFKIVYDFFSNYYINSS